MELIDANPMFSSTCRKNVCSLYDWSSRTTARLISNFCDSDKADSVVAVDSVRRYYRKHLPVVILTDLLSSIVPAPSDRWRFSCVTTKELLHCKIHPECELVYNKLDKIVKVLFSEDISTCNINLKTVSIDLYTKVIHSMNQIFLKEPRPRKFPLLTSLVICGGSVHSDFLVKDIENLTKTIKNCCSNLENIHFPVTSNTILFFISFIKKIRAFKADRSKNFDKKGLYHLCHPESESRRSLQVLHIGVFKHSHFEKQDVSVFLKCMEGLVEFSLLDHDRALAGPDGSSRPGDKVLIYSVFKIAIRDFEQNDRKVRLVTNIKEMCVVDRSLKPHYILESAPNLTRLSIDWQQELSFTPFNRYSSTWFTDMIKGNSWSMLARRLERLDITFPSAHSINSYSLPLEDYTRLMENLPNLTQLRLSGAGQGAPVPLIPILKYCPKLKELTLEKSPVHVPDNYDVIDQGYISKSLQKFYFLGEMSSLLVHNFMMRGIANYMPELRELEVQPQAVIGYSGLTPDQILELSCLKKLEKLSVPLSIRECIMNLPQIIFVLREFPALRYLTLSWGLNHESYDISKSKIRYMMDWLFNALGAENANIHLQLSYKQHPQEYKNKLG